MAKIDDINIAAVKKLLKHLEILKIQLDANSLQKPHNVLHYAYPDSKARQD